MVDLTVVIIGEGGSLFNVTIDENAHVSQLHTLILARFNTVFVCEASELQLYLAKTIDGMWMTYRRAVGVGCAAGLPYLHEPHQRLRLVGLAEVDVNQMDEDEDEDCQVHLLAIAPSDVLPLFNIAVDERHSADAFASYRATAQSLSGSTEVQSLSRHLFDVGARSFPVPFVVLESSTGMGKTQMAFNLQASGTWDVFHIVCDDVGEQSVYNAYSDRMRTFRACVRSDLETMSQVSDVNLGSTERFLETPPLLLFGFILAALRGHGAFIEEAGRADVEQEIWNRQSREAKPMVFFLDEFPRVGRTGTHLMDAPQRKLESEMRTMRNVFRSFGLPVVICSTNGTARDLLATSDRSPVGARHVWCVVIPSVPRLLRDTTVGAPPVVADIIANSRPRFARMAMEYVRGNQYSDDATLASYLDAMAIALRPQFTELKRRSPEFETAQLALFLCTSYEVAYGISNTLDGHFARLYERTVFSLALDELGGLRKRGLTWTHHSVLPTPEEDTLLHLVMMGGPRLPPNAAHPPEPDHPLDRDYPPDPVLTLDPEPRPAPAHADVFSRPFEQRVYQMMTATRMQSILRSENTLQRSNDGMALEALAAAAIVVASHTGGFGRDSSPFARFLYELLVELGVSEPDSSETVELPSLITDWNTQFVPFLSPPNAPWPTYLREDDSTRFGDLIRTDNGEGIDFRTNPDTISGECKDYSGAIKLSVMRNVLKRVPIATRTRSRTHLVVVNTLQQLYFKKATSWKDFVRDRSLTDMAIFRVSNGSRLEGINGMENPTTGIKRVVIFIERG